MSLTHAQKWNTEYLIHVFLSSSANYGAAKEIKPVINAGFVQVTVNMLASLLCLNGIMIQASKAYLKIPIVSIRPWTTLKFAECSNLVLQA